MQITAAHGSIPETQQLQVNLPSEKPRENRIAFQPTRSHITFGSSTMAALLGSSRPVRPVEGGEYKRESQGDLVGDHGPGQTPGTILFYAPMTVSAHSLHCACPDFGQLGAGQLQQGLQPRQIAVTLY